MKTKKLILNFNSTNRMKKPITLRTLLASAVLCMSIAFVACQKNEVSNPSNVAKNEVKSTYALRQNLPNMLVGCYDPNPQLNTIDCKPCKQEQGCDCTNFITVYGLANIASLENIFTVIDTQDMSSIAASFEENRPFLLNYISSTEVDGVINQQLSVKHHYNPNTNTHFLIFKQGNGLTIAYPLQIANE